MPDGIGRNRVTPLTRRDFFHMIAPDSSRLPKVGLTRHDCCSHTKRLKSRLIESGAIVSQKSYRLKTPLPDVSPYVGARW